MAMHAVKSRDEFVGMHKDFSHTPVSRDAIEQCLMNCSSNSAVVYAGAPASNCKGDEHAPRLVHYDGYRATAHFARNGGNLVSPQSGEWNTFGLDACLKEPMDTSPAHYTRTGAFAIIDEVLDSLS